MSSPNELLANPSKRARTTPRFEVSSNRVSFKDKEPPHEDPTVLPVQCAALALYLFSYPTPTAQLQHHCVETKGRESRTSRTPVTTARPKKRASPSSARDSTARAEEPALSLPTLQAQYCREDGTSAAYPTEARRSAADPS